LGARVKSRFIEPMLLLRTEMLPEGPEWGYEIKLDGYRTLAFKSRGKLSLRSRNDDDFALRYLSILACSPGLQAVDEPQILAHRPPLL
jgi:ATP-dependent DNA ligase